MIYQQSWCIRLDNWRWEYGKRLDGWITVLHVGKVLGAVLRRMSLQGNIPAVNTILSKLICAYYIILFLHSLGKFVLFANQSGKTKIEQLVRGSYLGMLNHFGVLQLVAFISRLCIRTTYVHIETLKQTFSRHWSHQLQHHWPVQPCLHRCMLGCRCGSVYIMIPLFSPITKFVAVHQCGVLLSICAVCIAKSLKQHHLHHHILRLLLLPCFEPIVLGVNQKEIPVNGIYHFSHFVTGVLTTI